MKKIAAIMLLTLAACSPPPEEGKVSDTGRVETRSIEAADTLGFQGKPVRQKVDAALDTNDQRVDQLNQSIDAQSQ